MEEIAVMTKYKSNKIWVIENIIYYYVYWTQRIN